MQVQVPKQVQEFVIRLQQYEPVEEVLLIKQAFDYGLEELRKEYAIKLFAQGKVSLSEGAGLADLAVGEYMDLLASRGIKSKITLEDYQQGLKHAQQMFKS